MEVTPSSPQTSFVKEILQPATVEGLHHRPGWFDQTGRGKTGFDFEKPKQSCKMELKILFIFRQKITGYTTGRDGPIRRGNRPNRHQEAQGKTGRRRKCRIWNNILEMRKGSNLNHSGWKQVKGLNLEQNSPLAMVCA